MPKSTSPELTILVTSCSDTSCSSTFTPGWLTQNSRITRGSISAAWIDDAEIDTRPRPSVRSSLEFSITLSISATAFFTSGSSSAPACVMCSWRVWRSNSFRPRLPSSSWISALTDDCDRSSFSAARVKWRSCATAMNARSWRSDTFMLLMFGTLSTSGMSGCALVLPDWPARLIQRVTRSINPFPGLYR
ncbi:hypothetical protein FQZ97_748900 [compost metagenome]